MKLALPARAEHDAYLELDSDLVPTAPLRAEHYWQDGRAALMAEDNPTFRHWADAAAQVLQFARRMFVPEKRLFLHGWVDGMASHPAFHWGRANGWAVMAAVELLSVMPDDHPQHAAVLAIFRAHARGLAACQGGDGLWHQLLDRPDSYPESSASAMLSTSNWRCSESI